MPTLMPLTVRQLFMLRHCTVHAAALDNCKHTENSGSPRTLCILQNPLCPSLAYFGGATKRSMIARAADMPTDCHADAGLDLSQLGIVSGKKCWVLHTDALIIGADGSLADATSLAVKVRSQVHTWLRNHAAAAAG